MPAARRQGGYRGYVAFYDREAGVTTATTLWQDEATERLSDEAARETREELARAAGADVRGERFEVASVEVVSEATTE